MSDSSKKKIRIRFDGEFLKLLLIMAGVFFLFTMINPKFAMRANVRSMMFQLPELGFYTLAMMMAILVGGRDLSIVSVGNLSAVVACRIMQIPVKNGYTGLQEFAFILLGIVCALLVGLLVGAFNGFVISKWGIPPMLATMAMSYVILGIALIMTAGKAITGTPEAYHGYGNKTLLGIPYTTWLLILAIAFSAVLLYKTRFGFDVKMVGSNPMAARFSGTNLFHVIEKAFIYSGVMSSICGLCILMRNDAAQPDYATTYSTVAILSAVLGGTNPKGGVVKLFCIMAALLSLQFLSSGFNIAHLSAFYKEFTWGGLLIITMASNSIYSMYRQKQGEKKAGKRSGKEAPKE